MSDHATVQPATAPAASFWEQHHFLIRRLHSLSGIVPVGAFLIEHLFTSSAIMLGPKAYQTDIDFIWHLPGLLMMEIFTIWLPLAFHAGLGMVYMFAGAKMNNVRYPYQDNWRYTWQRVTGMIALVYIFLHISTTRWHWTYGSWSTPFDPAHATTTTINALQSHWWLPCFFMLGMLATVFHFANGLWTAAITWGLTVSVAAQKRWGYVCIALGVLLALAGSSAIVKFATMSPADPAVIAVEIPQVTGGSGGAGGGAARAPRNRRRERAPETSNEAPAAAEHEPPTAAPTTMPSAPAAVETH